MVLDYEVVRLNALDAADQAAWRAACTATPAYSNPFFSPSFAAAVAQVRTDVRVTIGRKPRGTDSQSPVVFFPFHRRPAGLLRPLAAPVSDWHGPVVIQDEGFDPACLIARSGSGAARFTGLADPTGAFAPYTLNTGVSWRIDLSQGAGAYRGALKAAQPKNLANTQRCARKAERELGPVRYAFHCSEPAVMDTIIAWKRQRFVETGRHDIFSSDWIRTLFGVLASQRGPGVGLVVSTLHFGDRLAAGEIYLRKQDRMHAWISAFDRDLGVYAPGHVLTDCLLDVADAHGVRQIDFGAGNDEYKSRWCLSCDPIFEAVVHAASAQGKARQAMFSHWRRASPALGRFNAILTKARSRADHVFAAQDSWARASLALALSALARRQGVL